MWCKCWQKWSQQTKTPGFCSNIEYRTLDPRASRACWGCSLLFPAPCMQPFLGLPALPLSDTTAPPETPTAPLCRTGAVLLHKPRVPRVPRACCRGWGLSWGEGSGCSVLKLPGQTLHMLPGTWPWTSTQKYGVIAFWTQLMALKSALWVLLWVLICVIWISNAGEKTPKRFVGLWVGAFFSFLFFFLLDEDVVLFVCFQMC